MWLEYASVTTTENFILSALTVKEPRRSSMPRLSRMPEMCSFLELLGAKIVGKGTSMSRSRAARSWAGGTTPPPTTSTRSPPSSPLGGDRRRHPVRNDHPEHFDLIDRTSRSSVRTCARERLVAARCRLEAQGRGELHLAPHHQVEAAPWPYCRPTCCRSSSRSGSRPRLGDVLEQGLRGRADLAHRAEPFGAHNLLGDPHRLIPSAATAWLRRP